VIATKIWLLAVSQRKDEDDLWQALEGFWDTGPFLYLSGDYVCFVMTN
jgi:hypothetical protein